MNRRRLSHAGPGRTEDFRGGERPTVTDRSAGSRHEVDALLDEVDAVLEQHSTLTQFRQRPGH